MVYMQCHLTHSVYRPWHTNEINCRCVSHNIYIPNYGMHVHCTWAWLTNEFIHGMFHILRLHAGTLYYEAWLTN